MRKKIRVKNFLLFSIIFFLFCSLGPTFADELPLPSYLNSVVISIEHNVLDSDEVDYIKNNFNWGLYTWLSFSKTAFVPVLDWHTSWDEADEGIESFKNQIDQLIEAAKAKNVKLHIVLVGGLVRYVSTYRDAKEEDIRNCQWYNDNKLAADDQITDPNAMDKYIWGTLSRYARKMRRNLEAKAKATLAFLKQKMDDNPDVIVAISGWGEVELNFNRLNSSPSIQNYFCDYSPFAVLEFRDWILHTGMYDDISGKYAGEGWSEGGSKYQGASGLAKFNQDFGTSFTTWDLKYYNWSLNDDYDSDPTDYVNNDPHRISWADYDHGNMMPTSGSYYIPGGFDPPRVMEPGEKFWDLWNLFRETMVHHYVKDMARWAAEAGIPAERWFSHQIAADYLFGSNPEMGNLRARYYSSASPLWTANIQPWGSAGATIYDIKYPSDIYPPEFARTTKYAVPAISSMSSNWAVMEYDAETYPTGLEVTPSSPDFILDQYMRIYNYGAHLINFFRWWDSTGEHRIKGMNKEEALRMFIERIRDKARRTDDVVFEPPKVSGGSVEYNVEEGAVYIDISDKIWDGYSWEWKNWGDFDHFEIHRSTEPGFTPNAETLIGTTSDYSYKDLNYIPGQINYYKIRAINSKNIGGPYSDELAVNLTSLPYAMLSLSRKYLYFGAEIGGSATSAEEVLIENSGSGGTSIQWTATPTVNWIKVNPTSYSGDAILTVSVDISGLKKGTYNGSIIIEDPKAYNSPQLISVQLKVYPANGDSPPFGSFATPQDDSTVRSSIPVTGWALDDVEVESVKIFRDPLAGEPTRPNGLVYIGDAVFVEGSRPDIEEKFPEYPMNHRAGWGYMLLTYGLPDRGMSGTYKLYAIAYDKNGNNTVLGTKTIHCDNKNAVLPFGAIATPPQGGEASGSTYINWGWALTPLPNMIPIDGSTIDVIVDGVEIGHPVYNNYRPDVANLFPEYLNSLGASGYFYLDTTKYENGVHTIVWRVRDNAGNVDGVGSRYFKIINTTGESSSVSVGSTRNLRVLHNRNSLDLSKLGSLKKVYSNLEVKKGFQLRERETVEYNSEEREFVIYIEETEVVEIKLLVGSDNCNFKGYLKVGEELRPLPIGSYLDERKGIFYWLPGPGFLGEYNFIFIDENREVARDVKIIIKPKTFREFNNN